MNEEQKDRRRAAKTRWEREHRAKMTEDEKRRKNQAMLDRYHSETSEQRSHTRALQRQAWANRKRKADLAKMSPEQREHEVDRWAKLAPEEQETENKREFQLYIRNWNAILDIGTDTPDHTLKDEWSYARDKKVRDAVLKRANGKCEFCGNPGFIKPGGKRYLETHHVISLANDGADRMMNVIALCPNDHREAHFGKRRKGIEKMMILQLKALNDLPRV